MLKTINGRGYMTGTSEGSLYPVVLRHSNGVHIGARLELAKTPKEGLYGMMIYARIEKYDVEADGVQPISPTVAEIYEAMPDLQMRVSSKTHISGSIGEGLFEAKGTNSKAQARATGKVFAGIITKIGEKLGLQTASEDDLRFFGQEAYLTKIANAPDEAKIEAQMGNTSPFDFQSLLSTPSPSDPKPGDSNEGGSGTS